MDILPLLWDLVIITEAQMWTFLWNDLGSVMFETGLHCVIALAVLELDQVDLELTEICLFLPPKCWD